MIPYPRRFQQYALEELAQSNSSRILLSAPTGAGKAILLMMIVDKALQENKKVLLLVDRLTLIDQLSQTATQCGLSHNLICGAYATDNVANFTIASIQSIFRKNKEIPVFDLILIDEAHTLYKDLTKYLQTFNGRVIGATATPFTSGLGHVYHHLINCTTAQQLTKMGILVPLLPYTFRPIDMDGANTVGGEWVASEVQKRSRPLYGDVVATYIKCVYGLRSICFCANIAHCEEVAEKFKQNNVPVGIFTGKTTPIERAKLLKDFDEKKIFILISVVALAKGFDKSYVQCILDLRPLRRSLAEYIQMIGRGLRQGIDKKECYLLDFTGNIDRFLPDFEDIYFNGVTSLDTTPILNRVRSVKEKPEVQQCPMCDNEHMHNVCMNCGYKKNIVASLVTVDQDVQLFPVEIFKEKKIEIIPPTPLINLPNPKIKKINFIDRIKRIFQN